ncbi:MAG: ABC transporter permease, partial [Bdellovibrionales bacterium]|nr:ABC transporter permease [Bdellovibrionales bacterium]
MVVFLFNKLILSKRAGNLVRRISRLSMIGIGVSLFAFLIILFVMSGMNESIENRIVSLEPHLTVIRESNKSIDYLENHPIIAKLKDNPEVKRYSVFETQDIIIRTVEGQSRGAMAMGFSRQSLDNFNQNLIELDSKRRSKNKNLESDQWIPVEPPGVNEVFLGSDLARMLGV